MGDKNEWLKKHLLFKSSARHCAQVACTEHIFFPYRVSSLETVSERVSTVVSERVALECHNG